MLKEVLETIRKEYRKTHPRPQGHCKWCGRDIFNLQSNFGRRKECAYCYAAYKRGREEEEHIKAIEDSEKKTGVYDSEKKTWIFDGVDTKEMV